MEPPTKRARTRTPDDNRSSPRRPLFHSPTKSSLAKHAPHLIRQSPARSNPLGRKNDSGYASVNGVKRKESEREKAREGGREMPEEMVVGAAVSENVRAVMKKVRGLKSEIQHLEEQVRRERERIQREEDGGNDGGDGETQDGTIDVDALMNSLLASNDTHLATHTTAQTTLKKTHSAIPSARPLRLDDPFPSLRAFSQITYTRLETLALGRLDPSATDDDPDARDRSGIIREDRMSGYAGDRELFFRVRMRIDTRVHSVTELDAEVSAWARRELGSHLDFCIQSCNISSLLASLSSFTKQSNARSKVFALLTRLRPDLVAAADLSGQQKPANAPLSTAEVMQYQGRTLLRLKPRAPQQNRDRRSGPSLKVPGGLELLLSWEIGVDSLGEAKSRVRMGARWSGKWSDGQGKEALDQIEEMFDGLVKRKGVLGAATGLLTLVFPQAPTPQP